MQQAFKSKNQLWRESGSGLSFKEWMQQHINLSVQQAIIEQEYLNYDGSHSNVDGGENITFKPELENTTILGINKNYLLIGGIIIVGFCLYKASANS